MVEAGIACRGRGCARGGFSTTELIVTVAIVAVLVAVSVVALNAARRERNQAVCAANLHAVGVAFNLYAADYRDHYPVPTTAAQWEELLRPFAHRNSFHCPADEELFAAFGSSYDWRDTGDPKTGLVGKTQMDVVRSDTAIAFDMLPGWHSPQSVQVLRANMSVQLMDQNVFFTELHTALKP